MQFNSYERLPRLRAATPIIHGDADRLIPVQNARILNKHIPDSRLYILPGAGHSFSWEKPKESAEAIGWFLSSVP